MHDDTIGIVGAGSIGIAFAIVFARAGHAVHVVDTSSAMLESGPARVGERLALLSDAGLLDQDAADVLARIAFSADLAVALEGAALVIECVPENLELKRTVLAQIDAAAPSDAVLATATSTLPVSAIAENLPGRDRCLVVHPANPPYLVEVVEIVPAPFTSPEAVETARALLSGAGMSVVALRKEVEGFVYNRLQGAVLREAYCLVRDGVVEPEEIDALVRDGLGLRWSVVGPFETVDLNTRGGIAAHAERLGPAYERMGAERGQHDPWTPDLVARVAARRRELLPLDEWDERVMWRDSRLASLQRWRRDQLRPGRATPEEPANDGHHAP